MSAFAGSGAAERALTEDSIRVAGDLRYLNFKADQTITDAIRAVLRDKLGAVAADSPALTGTPTAPTAPGGAVSTQIATTEFASKVRDNPRILAVAAPTTSLNLGGVDVIYYSASSPSVISSFSNVIAAKQYLFINMGSGTLTIDRSAAYLPNSATISLGVNGTFLACGRTATQIMGAAPAAING